MTYTFTTIINKDDDWYVARCAELGVVSQGETIKKAQENLKEAVELYLEDSNIIDKISYKQSLITTFNVELV